MRLYLTTPHSPLLLPTTVLPPLFHPLLHPLQVPLNILCTLTPQLHNNLLLVALPCLVKQHLHDLAVHILFQLLVLVAARCETIVQECGVAAKHDDEVDPAFGEEVAGVPVEDVAACAVEGEGFEMV